MCPDRGPNLQPRHVPWPGIELAFRFVGWHPTNSATLVRAQCAFLIIFLVILRVRERTYFICLLLLLSISWNTFVLILLPFTFPLYYYIPRFIYIFKLGILSINLFQILKGKFQKFFFQNMECAPSMDRWISKMWYIQTMEYCLALKRKKILPHAVARMTLWISC